MIKKAKKQAHLDSHIEVSQAIQTILRHQLDYLTEWEDVARSPDDIEGVHQTRVAFRRMRSALTIFRQAIPKSVTSAWGQQMSELAGQLGKARDLDVFIDEALGRILGRLPLPGEEQLEVLVRQHRDRAYEGVRTMLDSEAYARFKQEFGAWVDGREWEKAELKDKQRKRLQSSLASFARKVLDRQERRVLEAGTHVNKHSAEEMHRLRIECKKLRYAAEFFLPLFDGMVEFIGHMKGIQDLLGVMNDVVVMRGLLDEVLEGVQEPEPPAYAGGIIGWRTCTYHQLLESFDERWEELVEAKHPWWKKSSSGSHAGEGSG